MQVACVCKKMMASLRKIKENGKEIIHKITMKTYR